MSRETRIRENLMTLQDHLARKKLPPDLADLPDVIAAVVLASKSIASKVRRARIEDVIGEASALNVQGEVQQKLDVISNDLMLHCLERCRSVAVCVSEEEEEAVLVRPVSDGGRYAVIFDPLDGSSNINVAVGVGTIFSVLRNQQDDAGTALSVLQPGERQVAAGYVLYGSSVLLVLTLGDGVDMYVLDPDLGDFVLVEQDLAIPNEKKIYSVNEAYVNDFPSGYQRYLEFTHANGYTARYIGSMVADVHRTLLKGGVFLYPPTAVNPNGKLRLLYEASPMAFIIEQAGGAAATGDCRILEVEPKRLHQRTPVILGSPKEVDYVTSCL